MDLAAWITISVVGIVIIAMITNKIGPDIAMLGGLTALMLIDQIFPVSIIDPMAGIQGFSHPAVIMIGCLFIVAAGMSETGATEMIAQNVLGMPKSLSGALVRLMVPVAAMSAFMNNTAVVAMYMPIVSDWARKMRVSPSKLFIPLSFAAILGGTCTLIATASNVTVNGLYEVFLDQHPEVIEHFNLSRPGFLWVTSIGLPVSAFGMLYLLVLQRWLLPNRITAAKESTEDERQYSTSMIIKAGCPIIGKTIEDAGLRHLPGLYLNAIERGDDVHSAIEPDTVLREGDLLSFVGILESVIDLKKIRGLVPATDETKKVRAGRRNRTSVEAVVSSNSPLAGRSVRESQFRTQYNAAIIAVHRHGHQMKAKIGDIVLQPGDVLLLDTHMGFVKAYRNSRDFYLVSQVEGSREIRHERATLSIAILLLMVAMLAFTSIDKVVIVLFAAGLMIASRCCTGTIARRSISIQVLFVIAAALGIGQAMQHTGAAAAIADLIISTTQGLPPIGLVFLVFVLTSLFAQLVTNNGAAVLMFPIAMQIRASYGLNPEPFVMAIMIAAACNFMTPVTYQTNMMIFGPGGYKFTDFCKVGVPLTILTGALTAGLTALFFDMTPSVVG